MKVIRVRADRKEIEVENSFLFWTYRTTYRKVNRNVFEYKHPNEYIVTSINTHARVADLFHVDL
jgi:hypothetical protein